MLSRGSLAAPAVSPVVTATGGGGRNSSGLDNPEFVVTIPADAGLVAGVGRQLRRRAGAARRLPGGDPWTAGLRRGDSVPASAQLAAWSAACADLAGAGFTPVVPRSIAREIHRRGGAERELIERVYRAGGIAA